MIVERDRPLLDSELASRHPKRDVFHEMDLMEDEDYCPWAPTSGLINHPEIAQSKIVTINQAKMMLNELRPQFVSADQAAFVERVYLSREANRSIKNTDSYGYHSSLHDLVETDFELGLILKKAELGKAKPGEILGLIDTLGMGSAEIAKLTHIYGNRLEFQELMREDVKGAIRSKHGEVYDNPEIKYGVVMLDTASTLKEHLSFAIAMKRKTRVGRVGGTVIYERMTFIIQIDEKSHIDQAVAFSLKSIQPNDSQELKNQVMNHHGFKAEVIRLLQSDDLNSLIPMSTTIFACNNANLHRLETERQKQKQQSTDNTLSEYPALRHEIARQKMLRDTALNGTLLSDVRKSVGAVGLRSR